MGVLLRLFGRTIRVGYLSVARKDRDGNCESQVYEYVVFGDFNRPMPVKFFAVYDGTGQLIWTPEA